MEPTWIHNGAKMISNCFKMDPKWKNFCKPNPPKMKTKSNEAWIKTSVKFLMLLSAPWGPRDPSDPEDPQGPQGPQGTPGTPGTQEPQGTPGTQGTPRDPRDPKACASGSGKDFVRNLCGPSRLPSDFKSCCGTQWAGGVTAKR